MKLYNSIAECLINPWPDAGNITCTHAITARGQYIVKSGHTCHLTCKKGFVTIDAKETVCQDGTWSESLYCVKPGAMLVVGGRGLSGVLPTVELITSGGVCKNIVPDLPHSRWKMITASVEERHVVACGGVNFLGDPKTDCWRLDFSFNRPRWTDMPSLNVPRDAAAWAAESGLLYVMGGNLGPLSGYTASVEVYNPSKEEWTVGHHHHRHHHRHHHHQNLGGAEHAFLAGITLCHWGRGRFDYRHRRVCVVFLFVCGLI